MWYNIHMSKPRTRTKLEEIESALKRELASRRYPQGERLPGENVLAESFGAARETVRKAIASLAALALVLWLWYPLHKKEVDKNVEILRRKHAAGE